MRRSLTRRNARVCTAWAIWSAKGGASTPCVNPPCFFPFLARPRRWSSRAHCGNSDLSSIHPSGWVSALGWLPPRLQPAPPWFQVAVFWRPPLQSPPRMHRAPAARCGRRSATESSRSAEARSQQPASRRRKEGSSMTFHRPYPANARMTSLRPNRRPETHRWLQLFVQDCL